MEAFLRKNLKGPPFIRLPVDDYIKCSRLVKTNNEALAPLKECMSEKSSLWTEISMLERSVYKMKNKWKLEPVFRGLRQVLKCMKILESERILQLITNALDSVLGLDGKILIPSRQYLQYLLVKIIGVGRLAVQTAEYCTFVYSKLVGKIRLGHLLPTVMSLAAIVSRIWLLNQTLLVQLRTCYNSIYSLHLLAAAADYTWLPDAVTLPSRFPIHVENIIQANSGCDPRLVCDNSTLSTESSNEHPVSGFMAKKLTHESKEDLGVVISRDSFSGFLDQAKLSIPSAQTSSGTAIHVGKIKKVTKKKMQKTEECDQNQEEAPNPHKLSAETTETKSKKKKKKRNVNMHNQSPQTSLNVSSEHHTTQVTSKKVVKKKKKRKVVTCSKSLQTSPGLNVSSEDHTTEETSKSGNKLVHQKKKKLKSHVVTELEIINSTDERGPKVVIKRKKTSAGVVESHPKKLKIKSKQINKQDKRSRATQVSKKKKKLLSH